MSVCLESTTVLTNPVGTSQPANLSDTPSTASGSNDDKEEKPAGVSKSVAKIIVANSQATGCTTPVLQKVVNSPLITVVNTPGPITVVKTSLGSTSAPHFTLVNSTPLNVKSASTITLLNAPPITVVKAISGSTQPQEQSKINDTASIITATSVNNGSLATVTEKTPLHNVFVKKPISSEDVPQSHKILTANSFPASNMMQNLNTPGVKTINGQRPITGNKVKILSNVVMPGNLAGPSNVLLNKSNTHRFYQQKNIGNGATKYINKPVINNVVKTPVSNKGLQERAQQRIVYPTHKSHIKTLPGVNNNYANKSAGIKTLSPQNKTIPGQVQKTGCGLRTIPPQRPSKSASKPNYIGKHAVQAQKLKQSISKVKTVKPTQINSYHNRMPQTSQMTFNQALTAQILETLGRDSSKSLNYETPPRYESSYNYCESRVPAEQQRPIEYKPQSNLDTLSFVCQAVLLDHNYNATLPAEIPINSSSAAPQINGITNSSLYSGNSKRARCVLTPSNTLSSLSSSSLLPSNTSHDDDAASDISCTSDRKQDTEGEETDTAPEAEAVTNDDQFDRYGDYVTRCICGFIHDDGYMIECDQCKVWQHVRCVVRNKKVPDDYLCEECDPTKPADRQKARVLQQQWMREVQEREARLRKEQLKETLSDSDSSDGDQSSNNNMANKSRRKSDIRQQRQRRDSTKDKRQLKRKMTKRKIKPHNKSNSDDEKLQIPQLRQWIDNYEEAVTNHYSPELRARVSSIRINGAHSELNGQIDPQVQKCKVQFNTSGVKYLVSAVHMSVGTPVIELRGKYMLSTQHRTSNHTGSLTTRQQRPGPFLFFYRLQKDNTEVCVDTRTYGNIARFIRRSCHPNAELRHCIEKGVLHLYIVAANIIEKNIELTIKHESHDLAVVGTTDLVCACGNSDLCLVNKSRKNGDNVTETNHRKRRGRRTSSVSAECSSVSTKPKEEPIIEEKPEVKIEAAVKPEIKEEDEEEQKIKIEEPIIKEEPEEVKLVLQTEVKDKQVEEEEEEEESQSSSPPAPLPPPHVSTRRSSHKSEPEEKKETPSAEEKEKNKKLSREERKLQAIMKAIERMERQEQRKQEHQAKQAHRRESEPNPHREDDKNVAKGKRRKRKGRTRTLSTNSQAGRRNRLNSADSIHATSSDDTLLSPTEQPVDQSSPSKAAGLLLALANGDNTNRTEVKSPERMRDLDCNSNSSPETPLSSACLLVAAAVEPLEPGFKFPKTKKGLMNEWLNKGTDLVQSASSISPSSLTAHITPTEAAVYDTTTGFYTPSKNLVALAQAATYCDTSQPRASAKKRWLRQAISEDQCDSPCSRPDSPPVAEMVAPPKKRRLPRESLSSETSPASTPTNMLSSQKNDDEPGVEIVTSRDSDSPTQLMESESTLNELATEMKHEYGSCIHLPEPQEQSRKEATSLLDPRLSRERPSSLFTNSDHLVGAVEKTLSFLGFEDRKPETITPAKRKLSITEYRQRKKLNSNDKAAEEPVTEESNSSQSPKHSRNRSNSSSSATSCMSSDEEISSIDVSGKVLSAFNSEPTELERQRESVSLRLKKAFGLSVDEDSHKPALNVENILKCDLPSPTKTSIPLSSPTFPIPGSSDPPPQLSPILSLPDSCPVQPQRDVKFQDCISSDKSVAETVLYYTPDEEEIEVAVSEPEKIESASYVPPFNNPLYPNNSYTTFGSVIDDDAPYEGRNPSPPPNLDSMP